MKSSIKGDLRYSAVESKHLREGFFKEYVSQQMVGKFAGLNIIRDIAFFNVLVIVYTVKTLLSPLFNKAPLY